jgi:hypothetical protein
LQRFPQSWWSYIKTLQQKPQTLDDGSVLHTETIINDVLDIQFGSSTSKRFADFNDATDVFRMVKTVHNRLLPVDHHHYVFADPNLALSKKLAGRQCDKTIG